MHTRGPLCVHINQATTFMFDYFHFNYIVIIVFNLMISQHDIVFSSSLGRGHLLINNACSPASSSSSSSMPKMTGDSEGIDTHAHGFRGDGTKLLPIWAVFVDGFHLGGANCPRSHSSQSYELLGVDVHGVDASELTAGVAEENKEVVGRTLLHLLSLWQNEEDKEKIILVVLFLCLYDF